MNLQTCKKILKVAGIAVVGFYFIVGVIASVWYLWKFVPTKASADKCAEESLNLRSKVVATTPYFIDRSAWVVSMPQKCGCQNPASIYFRGNIPYVLVTDNQEISETTDYPFYNYFAHQLVTGIVPDKDRWLLLQCIDSAQALNNAMYMITTELIPALERRGLLDYWYEDMTKRMHQYWDQGIAVDWCPKPSQPDWELPQAIRGRATALRQVGRRAENGAVE